MSFLLPATQLKGQITEARDPAEQLLADLGCAGCHAGLPATADIQQYSPDLSDAGLRFEPAYLFSYLQNLTKVRQSIWPSRMPNFGFSPRETLALVLFLETQRAEKLTQAELPKAVSKGRRGDADAGRERVAAYECQKCHVLEGDGYNESVDLTSVGYRLQADWLRRYLVAPARFDGVESSMPSFFYGWDQSKQSFAAFFPESSEDLQSIAAFLVDLGEEKRRQLQEEYRAVKDANPDITAALGEQIFISQNCAACHQTSVAKSDGWKNGPDLSLTAAKVKSGWLRDYLNETVAVRPFGFYPGSGSRMPDFEFSEPEVDLLTKYLLHDKSSAGGVQEPPVKKLSAFSTAKAEKLLQDKLSCLGCHSLGQEGGRIAPNLANARQRLRPSYIRKVIQDPQAVAPHSIMPSIKMPEKQLQLIMDYVSTTSKEGGETAYLSLIDHRIYFYEETAGTEQLFLKHCAACHGTKGDADGFNARYLPTVPVKHSDAEYLSTRPDDTLFDGIYAGGAILNKSHFMPPWGATLGVPEIRGLVDYLRQLCNCRGPAWSEDNK